LADAIGVSESSVRRWVDQGQVQLTRTQGGHRRIPIAEAVRFIRASGATVVRPEILGLAAEAKTGGKTTPVGPEDDAEALFQALRLGNGAVARGMIVSAYLSGQQLAGVFDGLVRGALSRLGELWQHDERGILVEHRGSTIVIEALHQLRALLPPPPAQAPIAIGAAPEGDHYVVPSMMAAIVLREAGYRDINYGPNTPLALLAGAAREHHARLAWVSFSTQRPTRSSKEELAALAEALGKSRSKLVVGGRFAPSPVDLRNVPEARVIASMSELAAFAEGMRG
jgi:hypothetical protein